MRGVCLLLLLFITSGTGEVRAQERPALSVHQIMQDPRTWIGAWPTLEGWDDAGAYLYFAWNPAGSFPSDSLYRVARGQSTFERVPAEVRRAGVFPFQGWFHGEGRYTADFSRRVVAEDGRILLVNTTSGQTTPLVDARQRATSPRFVRNDQAVAYRMGDNLFVHDLANGGMRQVTDLRTGSAPSPSRTTPQNAWLEQQQLALFDYVRDQRDLRLARDAQQEADRRATQPPPTFYLGNHTLSALEVSPTIQFVAFTTTARIDLPNTRVPRWVNESGYVDELTARPKVGHEQPAMALYVQDLSRDTTLRVNLHTLPGAMDVPAFRREQGDTTRARRDLVVFAPLWHPSGEMALVVVRARDNKTRWIARLDPATASLTPLVTQQDDAWIGGPGMGGRGTLGWMPNSTSFFYQDEATGFSHLYVMDAQTGSGRALTEGPFEVSSPWLSRDGRTFYLYSTEHTPYEIHLYRMAANGGVRTRLTQGAGHYRVAPDPREELLAYTFSTSANPPDVFVQRMPGGRQPASPVRITTSTTEQWRAYPWEEPEIITVPASDGAHVPARIFRPERPNGAAVFFVHGAGYLQNVHRGWSQYFRETMFHHFLRDQGYVVLDLDYRASAMLGRDWRTGIARFMGGRDLQDYVDASRYVTQEFSIDPERVFIYGGSYGGFITLMALFTAPEYFGGGAALRSVTDWAHYNHGYTANILNTPVTDSLAIVRSSPIHVAEGYTGDPLLIPHGMVDVNVQFQDVVRLSQRLIELGKTGWEMAVYPVEDHGFTEPSSWFDEYRRIHDYIEKSVGPHRTTVRVRMHLPEGLELPSGTRLVAHLRDGEGRLVTEHNSVISGSPNALPLVLIAPTAGTFTLELSLQRGNEVLLRHRETLSTGEAMREVRPGR